MTIMGHGVDIVVVSRIAEMLAEHPDRFLAKCFTQHEAACCGDGPARHEKFSARFAAKEATLKAIGTGWRDGIAWTDVEVVTEISGRPTLRVTGGAAKVAATLGITRWHVSLSHTREHAIASVIAEA